MTSTKTLHADEAQARSANQIRAAGLFSQLGRCIFSPSPYPGLAVGEGSGREPNTALLNLISSLFA